MNTITTIGPDIAKNSFAVHGFDAGGVTVLVKELKRGQVLAFFAKLRPAASVWKPAPRHITGRGN